MEMWMPSVDLSALRWVALICSGNHVWILIGREAEGVHSNLWLWFLQWGCEHHLPRLYYLPPSASLLQSCHGINGWSLFKIENAKLGTNYDRDIDKFYYNKYLFINDNIWAYYTDICSRKWKCPIQVTRHDEIATSHIVNIFSILWNTNTTRKESFIWPWNLSIYWNYLAYNFNMYIKTYNKNTLRDHCLNLKASSFF